MSTIGQRIRSLRESRGLSQKELADQIGVSQGSIGNWEAGIRTNIQGTKLLKLATALAVDASVLVDHGGTSADTATNVTGPEAKLLAVYRKLNSSEQALAFRLISAICK